MLAAQVSAHFGPMTVQLVVTLVNRTKMVIYFARRSSSLQYIFSAIKWMLLLSHVDSLVNAEY